MTIGDATPVVERRSDTSVWRNRDFRLLWTGQTLSDLGSGLSQLAYPLLMLALTGSATAAGALSAVRALPYLVFGLPAGALADRWNRKRVMILCDAGRAITMATIPLALWLGRLTAAQLFVTGFVGGILFVFFSAAESACLPNVVEEDQVTSAVAALQTTSSVGGVLAPPLGGAMLQVFRGLPFLADALSYVASVVALSSVKVQFQRTTPRRAGHLRSEIAEGLTWLWSHPTLRTIAITGAGLQLAISGVALVVIVSARQTHASSATIGVLFAAVGIGGVIGSLIAPRIKARLGFGLTLLAVVWAQAVLWLLLAASSNMLVMGPILVVFAASMPVFGIASLSYRLSVTPDRLLSRIGTVFSLIIWATVPLGAAAAGLLLDRFGPGSTSLVFGAWVLGLAVIATRLRWRTARRAGERSATRPRTCSRSRCG